MGAKNGAHGLVLLRQVAAETYKFLTDRSAVFLAITAIVLPTFIAATYAWAKWQDAGKQPSLETYEGLAASVGSVAIVLGVMSIRVFAQEYLSDSVDTSRIMANRRFHRSFAKFVVSTIGPLAISFVGYSVSQAYLVWQTGGALAAPKSPAETYIFLHIGPAVALFSILASLIAYFSSRQNQSLIIFASITAIVPTALASVPSGESFHLTSLSPIACLQAITTFAGAAPFTMMGLPPSDFSYITSLHILTGWCILVACLGYAKKAYANRASQQVRQRVEVSYNPFIFEKPGHPKPKHPLLLAVKSALFAQVSSRAFWWSALALVIMSGYTTWLTVSSLLAEFESSTASTAEFSERLGQALAAPIQAESLIMAVLGTQIGARWFSEGEITAQLLAIPRRTGWAISQMVANAITFVSVAVLASSLSAVIVAVASTFSIGVPNGFASQAGWFLWHAAIAVSACGLVGISIGLIAQSNALGTISTLAIFVILPSFFIILSQPLLASGNRPLGNLGVAFPFASAAVQWYPENSFVPQVLTTGQVLLNANQELGLLTSWLLITATIAIQRVRHHSAQS